MAKRKGLNLFNVTDYSFYYSLKRFILYNIYENKAKGKLAQVLLRKTRSTRSKRIQNYSGRVSANSTSFLKNSRNKLKSQSLSLENESKKSRQQNDMKKYEELNRKLVQAYKQVFPSSQDIKIETVFN